MGGLAGARPSARCGGSSFSLAALGAVVGLVSCSILVPPESRPTEAHELAFNHRVHADVNLECSECHAGAASQVDAGLPALTTCTDCHDGSDDSPKIAAFIAAVSERPADARWVRYAAPAEGGDVLFSHAAHAAKDVQCGACHGDVASAEATGRWVAPTMATCVACHERQAPGKNDCATCHERLREDIAPPSHRGGWEREHGVLARSGELDPLLGGQCSACHERDTCLTCHRQEQPRSHDRFFVLRGHGLQAQNDRTSCVMCHEQDSCARCHEQTTPSSHRGGWGGGRNEHCGSCHVPVGNDPSCATCHQATPSHATATPMPPSHNQGMNCRQCHGNGQPLPHVDNGMECTSCHR